MAEYQLTPFDLAKRVNRSAVRVNKLLRHLYPELAPGMGGRWRLTDEMVAAVTAYIASGATTRSSDVMAGSPIPAGAVDVPADWYWEGHVQEVMVKHLRHEGWTILATSDTASRAQGDDINASKGRRSLIIEVKGYPSKTYRDPRRAREVKRTEPTLQAKHWYADAMLHLIRLRGTRPGFELAMALPEAPRYRALIAETEGSLRSLSIGLYVIGPAGQVEALLPHQT